MGDPFIGSEAIASGALTPYALRSRSVGIYPDVYLWPDTKMTAIIRAKAAWLWSGRRGVVAGRSAAALHGAKWVEPRKPAELLWSNRRPPKGIRTSSDTLADDEIEQIGGMRVTTPARTALDIACRYPLVRGVAAIDALARATHLKITDAELLVDRYRGRRGIRRARQILDLVDPGAESPQESWLRLVVIAEPLPAAENTGTGIGGVRGAVAVFDLGWEDLKIAMDYEGEHHRLSRRVFNHDIR